jgi:hypothetical protein
MNEHNQIISEKLLFLLRGEKERERKNRREKNMYDLIMLMEIIF